MERERELHTLDKLGGGGKGYKVQQLSGNSCKFKMLIVGTLVS